MEEGDDELDSLEVLRRRQEEEDEDRLIDQIGSRQLDERGDLILDVAAYEKQQMAKRKEAKG